MGPAKATLILAALEFARRRIRPEGLKISFPPDILPLIRHFADRKQEHFLCVSLNGANEVIQTRVVSVGLVNKTQVHPREVFADPITDRASAVIVAHNHPAGGTSPSQEDREVTQQLKSAGKHSVSAFWIILFLTGRAIIAFWKKGRSKSSRV